MTKPIKKIPFGTENHHLNLDVYYPVVGRQAPQPLPLAAANAVIRCSISRDGVLVVDSGVAVIRTDRSHSAFYPITLSNWALMPPGRYEERWVVTADDVNGRRPFPVPPVLFDVTDSPGVAAPVVSEGAGGFLFDDPTNLIWLVHA